MDYIIFDLEWSRNIRRVIPGCPDEIIQIGAVKYDKNLKYKGSFNRFITPSIYHGVDSRVAEITGITAAHLERFGIPFADAFRDFKAFMGRDAVLMSWGPQDIQVLRINAQYYDKSVKLSFMQRFSDLQRYAAARLHESDKQQLGLKSAAELCNIAYEPKSLHDAHVDAEISGEVFARVYDKKSFGATIYDASVPHSTAAKTEPTDKADAERFNFVCSDCGKELKNKSGWFRHETARNFFAFMRCPACKKDFFTTVEFFKSKGRMHCKKRLRPIEKIKEPEGYTG